MKHKSQITLSLGLLISSLSVVSVSAQTATPQTSAPGSTQERQVVDPIRQLNLSPEQREQIRRIREQNRDERAGINQRLRETNRALEEVLDADNPDESAVEQRVRDAAAAQAAAMRMRILSEVKIRRVLTPEQRTLLRAMRREVREDREQQRLEGGRVQKPADERSLQMRERRRNGGLLFPGRGLQRRPRP